MRLSSSESVEEERLESVEAEPDRTPRTLPFDANAEEDNEQKAEGAETEEDEEEEEEAEEGKDEREEEEEEAEAGAWTPLMPLLPPPPFHHRVASCITASMLNFSAPLRFVA